MSCDITAFHIADTNPRLTTAVASPHRIVLIVVPDVVPLVPANKANESRRHGAHLP
jgi:hypothetical protein